MAAIHNGFVNAAKPTAAQLAALARPALAGMTREVNGKTFAPRVSVSDNMVYIRVDVNGLLTEKLATELLREARMASIAAWRGAGLLEQPGHGVKPTKNGKATLLRSGFWHMGVYCTTGMVASFRCAG